MINTIMTLVLTVTTVVASPAITNAPGQVTVLDQQLTASPLTGCGRFVNTNRYRGSFTVTGSGVTQSSVGTFTLDQSANGTFTLDLNSSTENDGLYLGSFEASVSVNDRDVASQPGLLSAAWQGSGISRNTAELQLDLDRCIYTINLGGQIPVTFTVTPGGGSSTILYDWGPSNGLGTAQGIRDIPLPASGRTLSGRRQFRDSHGDWDIVWSAECDTGCDEPTPTPTPTALSFVQFGASTATATETLNATTRLDLTVTRSGDTSGAASVNYASSNGTANERSDYLAALGTIRFQPGEITKTIGVFIVDDSFGEAAETFNVTLSNPGGGSLGLQSTIIITINSNETVDGPNPVRDASFSSEFFVRQHYVDFFNRETDPAGLAFWKNQIDECTTQACREIRRINVSAAFFVSGEFQQTGYLVYKASQAAFNSGEQLRLQSFLPDTQEIGRGVIFGQPGADQQLETNKQNFFLDFVQRPAFLAPTAYPTTLTAAEFVDKLNGNTLDPRNPGAGPALTPSERNALVNQLLPDPTSPTLRAQVLRSVSENGVFTQRQFNKAFVLMQYFGYLRRNPNATPDTNFDGYNFWLSKLNQFNGNFVDAEMVKAFITSSEYIQRFGQ